MDANDWVKKHSTQIGTVVVIVAVVLVAYTLVQRSRQSSTDAAWQTMRGLSFAPAEAEGSFATLDDLIADSRNRDFKMTALLRKAQNAITLALAREGGFHPKYLDEAEEAYQSLLEGYSDRMAVAATALRGLAIVEESRFAVDNDLRHRARAEEYLQRLVNEPRFKGTPFQTEAARRLQEYDKIFQVVTMAEPESAPPAPLDVGEDAEVKDGDLELHFDRRSGPGAPDAEPEPDTGESGASEPGMPEPGTDTAGERPAPPANPEAADSDVPPESNGQ
jgi:hypothetical protein